MRYLSCALVLIFCAGATCAAAADDGNPQDKDKNAGGFRCANQKHVISVSVNDSGETVEGPVCAQVTVNVLRYTAYLGKKYAPPTAGPSLSSVVPTTWGSGGNVSAPRVAPPPRSLEDAFDADYVKLQSVTDDILTNEAENRTQAAALASDLATLQAIITRSDEVFQSTSDGPGAVLNLLKDSETTKILNKVSTYKETWKALDSQLGELEALQADVNTIPLRYPADTGTATGDPCLPANTKLLGWTNWDKCGPNDARFKLLQASITAAISDAQQWTSDSDKAAQFVKDLNVLNYWKVKAASLKSADDFILQSQVDCGVQFNQSQSIQVNLYTTDQTGIFPGQSAQQPVTVGVLNVNCTTSFSISAGAAFSTIKNPTFNIVQSAPPAGSTTPGSQVGMSSNSSVNPYPIAMANARLKDWAENRYALNYSFGVGVNPNGSGASPDFLTGPTLAFLRTVYLTLGLDIGKKTSLTGGYSVGSTVPSGVNPVPTTSSYTAGFGFGVTFSK